MIKRQESAQYLPTLSQIILITNHTKKIITAHYYFRFVNNVFLINPQIIEYKIPIKTQIAQRYNFSQKIIKPKIFNARFLFRKKSLQVYLFSYFLFFCYNPRPNFLYNYCYRFGPNYCSLIFYDFNSFDVLPLHDFHSDLDWSFKIITRFYLPKTYNSLTKYQFFSLIKIFNTKTNA